MSDEQGEVVIRGGDGAEHVFPAGFDPKKAAGIVRQRVAAESGVPTATAADMLTRRGISSNTSDSPETFSGLHQALRSAANPETAGDMLGLVQPNTLGANAMGALGSAVKAPFRAASNIIGRIPGRMIAQKGLQGVGLLDSPIIGVLDPRVANIGKLANAAAARMGTPAAEAVPTGLSAAETAIPKPQLPPQRQTVGQSPRQTVGQLRMQTGQGGPSGSGAIPPEPNYPTTVPDRVGSALDPARVDIGAELAGRQTGMTKQQVRDVATPILDQAPGEASPILPEKALKRIIDTIKELPKGGPEREAYVAKATSGKTQWQVENIRRTLEHLGLIVPVAVGGEELLRNTIKERVAGGQ